MLREIEAIAEELGLVQIELHVNADNARAIRFYRREGFDPIGRIPRALRHDGRDHDELLMVRRLDA
jgi:ribosomal protein S18 acetylase RimI-like enzyme